MNKQVSELILSHHRLAYIKTDIQLTVMEAGGSLDALRYLGLHEPNIRALNAERPGQGALFTFVPSEPYTSPTLFEILPDIQHHHSQILNVLHGLVPEMKVNALVVVAKATNVRGLVNLRTVPEFDKAGRIIGLLHLLEDVSDFQALHAEKQLLKQRVDMLQNQLDMVAHELGTPLTLVSGYLEILKDISDGSLNSEQKQCIELIEGNVDNLQIVVKSLFDIVFAEADGLRLALQPIDIVELLNSSVREFQNQLDRKSQKIIVQTSAKQPNALCDSTRIVQVINNLLSNASKFSPIGSTIEIEVTNDSERNMLEVAITDNGLGVTRDEQNIIFDRFYRTKFGKRAEAHGAGLGLYLCRMIIQMHGGQIWCQNSSERGSTFCFTLPCTKLPLVSWDHEMVAVSPEQSFDGQSDDSSTVSPNV